MIEHGLSVLTIDVYDTTFLRLNTMLEYQR